MDSPRKRETAGRLINYLLAHVTLALFGNFPLFCDLPVEGRENRHYQSYIMAMEVVFVLICLGWIIKLNSLVSSWPASI